MMQGTKTCISCNRFVNFIFHYGFCFTLRVIYLFGRLILFSTMAISLTIALAIPLIILFSTTTWRSDSVLHYGTFHSVFHYGYFSAMFYTMGQTAMFYTMGGVARARSCPIRGRAWHGYLET